MDMALENMSCSKQQYMYFFLHSLPRPQKLEQDEHITLYFF